MAARTWTPEQRQKQSEAIQKWKPWKQSTGPKSMEGKAAASRNAWTGGVWLELRKLSKLVNEQVRTARDMVSRCK